LHLAGRSVRPKTRPNVPFLSPGIHSPRPHGERLAYTTTGDSGTPSSATQIYTAYLDSHQIDRAILCHDAGMMTPALPNAHLSVEVTRAYNDWMIEHFLQGDDDRLYGLVLIPNQVPDAAVEEIRRVGKHSRMVGMLMSANGLGKPFGHPVYHAIYAAAAEAGLPIVTHAGAERIVDSLAYPTAGGLPATVTDYRVLREQAQMTHVVNMIAQGVFERFPTLRVLVLGAGVMWVAPLMWRFDTDLKALRRDAPWLKRLPSEYFAEFFRVGTFPLEATPTPEQIVKYLSSFRNFENIMCFASGFPDIDSLRRNSLESIIPQEWSDKVFSANAVEFFRWPGSAIPHSAEVGARNAPI
jgi:predicted TIM-barrel fold metal-dependent hydrolase